MDPILVCGFPQGSSLGLTAAFEWLGQPYRLARVDMIAQMREPAFVQLNPRVETPVLIRPDGSVLTETMAIGLWLEARDTERRISFAPGTAEADRMHQMMGFMNSSFTGAFSPFWAALEMKPNPPLQDALRSFGRAAVEKRHRQLEAMIGDTPFLAGDRPTLADALFIGVARWADFHQAVAPAHFPRLEALKSRLESDSGVIFAHAVEDGAEPRNSRACRGYVPMDDLLRQAA